jgi:hypothetical protein
MLSLSPNSERKDDTEVAPVEEIPLMEALEDRAAEEDETNDGV